MPHLFSQVPRAEIQRSSFNRDHTYKTAMDSNYLVPFFVDEVLPGDTFNLDLTLFGRLSTPVVPIMDNLYLDTFFFFVPNRLVWENWERFNGAQDDPGDSTDFIIPTVACNGASGTLFDYFGIPDVEGNGAASGTTIEVDSLPFRAYNLIWNEWFRDENLQNSVNVPTGDGPDNPADFVLLKRGKRHDYFTSALPWPQKGPGVELPLGQTAPVILGNRYLINNGNFDDGSYSGFQANIVHYSESSANVGNDRLQGGSSLNPFNNISHLDNVSAIGEGIYPLYADLSSASAATINSLRQAFQLQKLLERDARSGSRYVETLRAHFGVVCPDFRLQRPEFLGGSSTRVNINPVQQTSATDSVTPQGNLAAYGVVGSSKNGFNKSFVEHGYVIGLVNLRADLTYQQGLNRMWSRKTRYDFYWPVLAHLGEQTILNKEIFCDGSSNDEGVFGYQERYAEYRYFPNIITGKMRSTDANSLDVWHLAQEFSTCPTLSDTFISENVPLARSLAVQTEPQLILDVFFKLNCVRPMPVFGVPGLVDHF